MKSLWMIVISVAVTLSLYSCRDNPPTPDPKDTLPPYTETGANTFGCLINGKPFKPKGKAGSMYDPLSCEYQYVEGVQYFVLAARDWNIKNGIIVNGVNQIIEENTIYPLGYYYGMEIEDTIFVARYREFNVEEREYYTKPPIYKGELHIKNFDLTKQIISGTFWFDAVDTVTGEVIEVRDGRFDVKFTR